MNPRPKKVAAGATLEPVKLADVANAAGVALATASRALSNPNRVNAITRERVIEAAQKLGYSMNLAARNLRTGLSRIVLVVVPPWHSSDILEATLRAVDAELLRSGYSMIVGDLGEDLKADPRMLEIARGGFVDGLLAIANEPPLSGKLSILSARLPAVGLMIDLSRHGVPSVVSDDRHAVFQLTKALLAAGRRRFMYVSGPRGGYHDVERFEGFQDALAEVPGLVRPLRFEGDWSYEAGAKAAEVYLKEKQRRDAVVCCNDRMAIAFVDGVRRAGVRIPEDVAVAGFDDIDGARFCQPSLTTIHQSIELLGASGARLLLQRIRGTPPVGLEPVIVPSVLVRRETF